MNKPFFTFTCTALLLICLFSPLLADSDGPVEFKEYSYKRTFYPDGLEDSNPAAEELPYINVDIQFLEPTQFETQPAVSALRSFIYDMYFGGIIQGCIDDMLMSLAMDVVQDWQENGLSVWKDFPDAVHTASWDYQSGMSIEFNSADVVAFGYHQYQYSGGAHGIYGSTYFVYDLVKNKQVELNDFFNGDWCEALSYIITESAKEMYEVTEWGTLFDAGFFSDTLNPTCNFYLNEEGIVFHYDIYEVTPYVMGGIEILVPYEDFGVLLNTDGVIGRILDVRVH